MGPLPPLTKVLGLLQKVERQRKIFDNLNNMTMANVTNPSFSSSHYIVMNKQESSISTSSKECSHCKNKGHTVDECYRLQACTFCHNHGHMSQFCFKRKNMSVAKYKGKGGQKKI